MGITPQRMDLAYRALHEFAAAEPPSPMGDNIIEALLALVDENELVRIAKIEDMRVNPPGQPLERIVYMVLFFVLAKS